MLLTSPGRYTAGLSPQREVVVERGRECWGFAVTMNLKHRSRNYCRKGKTSCLTVRYLNQPEASKTKETSGVGGLALYLHVWLAMCLFQTAVFETHVWAIKSLMSDTCFIYFKTLSCACTTGTFSPSFPCCSPICSNPFLQGMYITVTSIKSL